jgi:serine/threonine protein kinase
VNSSSRSGDQLGEALRLFHEHRASGTSSDEQLLARHPDLRELLEALLEDNPAPEPQAVRPGTLVGDFELVERIGAGGMGEVWKARQRSLQRDVALKLLIGQRFASAQALERFRREALAGARLRHQAIVGVHAVGEAQGVHFIAQELVEGGRTLAHELRELRELPHPPAEHWRRTAERFALLADALEAAHKAGILHRDIKPSNILLERNGAPKLADFGLARVEGELELSRTGDMWGSPFYMSPEQAAAQRVELDGRSDVFSLGATLYETLALVKPFDGDTVTQVLTKILADDPVDPRQHRSLCPRELALICLKMLEKEPARRYASMLEVAADLRRFLAHEPIHARPSGPLTRTLKWVRRHPVLASSLAISLGAAVVLAALLFETRRAQAAERVALSAAESAAQQARAEAERAELAALQARESEANALLEASTSAEITAFLIGAFRASAPEEARGEMPSARDVLDEGVRRIRGELQRVDQGPLRARVLESLGSAYADLGVENSALSLLREAFEVALATLGPDAPSTWRIAGELAGQLGRSGQIEAAHELHTRAVDELVRIQGPSAATTLYAKLNLASAKIQSGQPAQAEALLREVEGGLEPDDERLDTARYNLSVVLQMTGRDAQALDTLLELLMSRQKRLGHDHPSTLNALASTARLASRLGHREEARALAEECARGRRCVLGEDHPQTLQAEALWLRELSALRVGDMRPQLEALVARALPGRASGDVEAASVLGMLASARRDAGDRLGAARANLERLELLSASGASLGAEWFNALGQYAVDVKELGAIELAAGLYEELGCLLLDGVVPRPDTMSYVARTLRSFEAQPATRRWLIEQLERAAQGG